ncbi:hypothetical protein FHG87_002741 [Trinorchestia longiramus]|nr:hypothetical protein FHG87_002741 [Trinorchestia longiramus]
MTSVVDETLPSIPKANNCTHAIVMNKLNSNKRPECGGFKCLYDEKLFEQHLLQVELHTRRGTSPRRKKTIRAYDTSFQKCVCRTNCRNFSHTAKHVHVVPKQRLREVVQLCCRTSNKYKYVQ